jgi:outer membrane receptor protein involved in Fe transport
MLRVERVPLLRSTAFVFLLAATCGSTFAQGLGSVVGTVTDPSGASIASVRLTITDQGTAQTRQTTTNEQGYYVFPSLAPSKYSLKAEVSGFAPYVQNGIVLEADQAATVDIGLSLSKSGQTITVEAQAVQVNTSTAALSEVVDTRRVVDLPLNGRNAASLALITAGTVLAPASADEGNTKTFPSDVTISANGTRQNQTSFRLDGAMNNDIYTNVNQPFPFPDALEEFSVQTTNYSSRYGGNAGGVVNIITKSGANQAHGDLFEFNRNAVFNARNFFASSRDQLKRNQFGGTFGGPVVIPKLYSGKDKTFFFMGYQGTRIRNPGNGQSSYVPTQAELNGDFSALLSASNPNNPIRKAIQLTNRAGQPYRNNQIPVSQFDPAAVALTKFLPSATGSGLVFYGAPLAQNFDEMIARVDHNISAKDRLSGRYFFDRFANAPFLDKSNYLNNSSFSIIDSHNLMLNETHMFGANLLNDLRISYSREASTRGPAAGSIDAADLGVQIYQPPGDHILESVSVAGYFSVSQTDPAEFIRDQYGLTDDVSWVHGQHSMTFGVDALRAWVLLRNQFHQPGQFTFSADCTGDANASFLLGCMRTFLQGNGEAKDNRVNTYGLYFEDNYHVSKRLTLNLGVRYDPFYPWKETKGRTEVFYLSDYNAGITSKQYTNAPPGLLFPGDPGVPQYGLRPNLGNFSPRIGFAYDLSGRGATSIRGGFGGFYDAIQNGIYNNRFVDVSPFSTQVNITNPPGPFSNPYLNSGSPNPFPAPYPPPSNIAFPKPVLALSYDTANGGVYQTPVVYGYNMTLEHQFKGDWLARVAYVGSLSRHLLESQELSPYIYIPGQPLDKIRYLPPYGSISLASQDINSNYNSLQVTAEKRFSRNFSVLANYTWSKSMDTLPFGQSVTTVGTANSGGSSLASPIPWYLPGRHQFDYGPSEFDHSSRFVTSFLLDLPKLNNSPALVKYAAGGWQLTGLFTYQSGGPITILAGKDQSGTGLNSDRAAYLGGDPYGGNACGTAAPCVNWVNPAAFGLPAIGSYGNVGKGALRGPNFINYDGGLFKSFPLHQERVSIQFRAEFFNLFNRLNLYNPNVPQSSTTGNGIVALAPSVAAAGFGTIKAAYDPRIGQLALKLIF